MLRTIFLLTLLSGCATATKQVAQPSLIESPEKCLVLFDNILSIQSQRSQLSEEFLREIETSPDNVEALREVWVVQENALRTEVTALYDIGYKEGCF